MRIAISALFGVTVTLVTSTGALAQQPPPPPEGPRSAMPAAPSTAGTPGTAGTPDAPPPPPGVQPVPEPPAAVASPFPPEGESADERMDLVGFRGGFFLRDSHDNFRFYPHGLLETDVYGYAGPGVSKTADLTTRLLIRRARVGFDGEFLKRWSFTALLEYGGQPLGNAGGTAETSAAKAGMAPTDASGRYAPVQSVATGAFPADVYINYSVCKCFNIKLGQWNIPFSMDNQTGDDYYPMMERSAAIRSFVIPGTARDIGGVIWGELGPRVFNYELGVFGGDGQNRPSVDSRVDFIGRIFARPFAGGATDDLAKYFQIGVSGRHGDRDSAKVAYDYTSITTGQGFALWKPTYTDSLGRQVHVIPSGAQNEIGGELRLRAGRFALQSEAYFVGNNTREAVDGYQLTNTERLGRMKGVGWYAQLSAWPFGDAFLTPEPGVYRPRHLDLSGRAPTRQPHGLEVIALVSGINANYDGASRLGSKADSKTPSGDITLYQAGVGVNYWHTKHVHVTFNYMAYVTPNSGTKTNEAVVPDNLQKLADGKTPSNGHVLHELGGRLAVAF